MSIARPETASGRRPYLAVPRYDGETKDFVLDEYNSHRGVHPNDSAMAMGMMVRRGSMKTDPTIGNTLHLIRDLNSDSLADDIRLRVEGAIPIERMIADGKVRIDKIEHAASNGSLGVVVYYTNLETDDRNSVGWYT